MPETITLADGSTREVLTAEEQAQLQADATKKAELEKKVADYESDNDWRTVRQKLKSVEALKENLKSKGIQVDESGNVISSPSSAAPVVDQAKLEELAREAGRQAALSTTFDQRRDQYFASLNPEAKTAAEMVYKKLVQGEQLTPETQQKFLEMAVDAAAPGLSKPSVPPIINGGLPPRYTPEDQKAISDTDHGKQLANEIFGASSFAQPPKQ